MRTKHQRQLSSSSQGRKPDLLNRAHQRPHPKAYPMNHLHCIKTSQLAPSFPHLQLNSHHIMYRTTPQTSPSTTLRYTHVSGAAFQTGRIGARRLRFWPRRGARVRAAGKKGGSGVGRRKGRTRMPPLYG